MASHSMSTMLMRRTLVGVREHSGWGTSLRHKVTPMETAFWPHEVFNAWAEQGGKPPSEYTITLCLTLIGAFMTVVLALNLRPVTTKMAPVHLKNPQEEEEEAESTGGSPQFLPAPPIEDTFMEARQPYSITRIVALTSMSFAYGFAIACQGLLLVPSEAKHLYPRHASEALGAMAVIAGMSQLAGPEAGHYSDIFRHPLGRRRPILIVGAAALWTLSFGCWFMSTQGWPISFMVVFFLMQMFWNIVYATASGLVPDLVPEERHGLAGSCSAAHVLSGSLLAFISMMCSDFEYHWYYGISAVITAATCVVVCAAAGEVSTANRITEEDTHGFQGLVERYKLDYVKYWDFTLLMITKTIYFALVVSKGFLMYFLRDAFDYSDASQEKNLMVLLGQVSMAAEGSAVLAAIAVMFYFDKGDGNLAEEAPLVAPVRRKPWYQWAVCIGSLWMAIWWNGPTYLALQRMHDPLTAGTSVDFWTAFCFVGNLIWGLGQGAYLAGDQALALALLPDRKEASRYLSFNCLCGFIGTSIGGLIVGGMLAVLGSGAEKGYAFPGYVAVFLYASFSSAALATVSLSIRVLPRTKLP